MLNAGTPPFKIDVGPIRKLALPWALGKVWPSKPSD
jgi:hypothetical protein